MKVVAKEITYIRCAREKKRAADSTDQTSPPPASSGLNTIFDLACGHGLLGVLLAYRFGCPDGDSCTSKHCRGDIKVVCVDLERRAAFNHYVEGFLRSSSARAAAHADTAAAAAVTLPKSPLLHPSAAGAADTTSLVLSQPPAKTQPPPPQQPVRQTIIGLSNVSFIEGEDE